MGDSKPSWINNPPPSQSERQLSPKITDDTTQKLEIIPNDNVEVEPTPVSNQRLNLVQGQLEPCCEN